MSPAGGGLVVPDRFAVMALDVGGTTGVARGVFEARETVEETLRGGVGVEAWEETGEPNEQAVVLAQEFLDWAAEKHLGLRGTEPIPVQAVILVMESFELRTVHADLSPVEVAWGIKALLTLPVGTHDLGGRRWPWEEQTPADAKQFGTSDRLKRWGLFVHGRGSDHKRDALRHLALRVAKMIEYGVSL